MELCISYVDKYANRGAEDGVQLSRMAFPKCHHSPIALPFQLLTFRPPLQTAFSNNS